MYAETLYKNMCMQPIYKIEDDIMVLPAHINNYSVAISIISAYRVCN